MLIVVDIFIELSDLKEGALIYVMTVRSPVQNLSFQRTTFGVGEQLGQKYVKHMGMFGLGESDMTQSAELVGPTHLVRKAKKKELYPEDNIRTHCSGLE